MRLRQLRQTGQSPPRRGVATVELAVILPFLFLLLFGIWEVGRFLDAQLLLEGAVREGARQAAAGSRRDPQTTELTYIYATPTSGQTDVETCVKRWLARSGINTTNVEVTFENLSNTPQVAPYTSKNHPFEANRLDQLRVSVSIPYQDVRWSAIQFIFAPSFTMTASVLSYSNKDEPFTVDPTIPND